MLDFKNLLKNYLEVKFICLLGTEVKINLDIYKI